jgi:hypothetical protein
VGILFILFDLLSTLLQLQEIKANLASGAYGIGYLMGSQSLLCIGLAFLYSSRRVQQKINRKKLRALEDTFMNGVEGQPPTP